MILRKDESDLRNHVQKLSTTILKEDGKISLISLSTSCCQGNVSAIMDLVF